MKTVKTLLATGLVLLMAMGGAGQVAAERLPGQSGQLIADALKHLLKGHSYTESVDMSFDVKPGGAFSLGTTNGSIKIATWEKEVVRLVITKTARASSAFDAKALLASFLVHTKQVGTDLLCQAKAQTDKCRESVGVTFTIWVPQSYNVDIKTETGSIDIGRLNGKFSAHTNDGKITLGYDPDDGLDIEVEDRTVGSEDADPADSVTPESPETDNINDVDSSKNELGDGGAKVDDPTTKKKIRTN